MKTLRYSLVLALTCVLLSPAVAQRRATSASTQPVDAASVPAAVLATWNAQFPGVTATKWVKKQVNDQVGYTAHFTKDGKTVVARIWEDGTYRWTAVHHTAQQVPADLAKAATDANPGTTVRWAKAITIAKKNFTYYKVRSAKAGSVVTAYFDQDLKPISKQSVNAISPEAEADTDDQ